MFKPLRTADVGSSFIVLLLLSINKLFFSFCYIDVVAFGLEITFHKIATMYVIIE